MYWRAKARCDLCRVRVVAAWIGRREQRPGHLDLALDGTVEVEVPVEAVVVIPDRGEERHDEPPLPSGLRRSGEDVEVLPQDPVIFLVDADRIRDHGRLAEVVGHRRVQVGDLAETIAAKLEG